MWLNKKRLPSEYQEVEYIESSGTGSSGQYINTGIIPEPANTVVKLRTIPTSSSYSTYLCACMVNKGTAQTNYYYGLSFTSNRWHCGYGTSDTTPGHPLVDFSYTWNWGNAIYDVEYRNDDLYVNDTLVANATTNVSNFQYPMFLFARNNSGTADAFSSFKLYSCEIYTSGTLVRDFVPCYRKSDNVIGIYDLENDQFYTNSGNGTFTKGNDVPDMVEKQVRPSSRLPLTYQEVEYIQSSGTQYINTGYVPTINDTIEIKFKTQASTSDTNLYGSRISGNNQDWTVWINTSSGKGIAVHYPYTQTQARDTSWFYTSDIINSPVELKITPQYCYVNNSIKYTFTDTRTAYTGTYNAYLFAQNQNGSADRIGKFTIYSCKIYNNGVIQRDLIPCYRKSDSVIGLYDLVNKQFYTNAGSGTFTKGPNV